MRDAAHDTDTDPMATPSPSFGKLNVAEEDSMSMRITISLPDDTYERASRYAAYAHREVSEIIVAALATSLPSLDVIDELRAISKLPDAELAALTELRMKPDVDRRLSELLDRQQAGVLTGIEHAELAALMRDYEIGLLRQSQAMAEAVHRGLLAPLES